MCLAAAYSEGAQAVAERRQKWERAGVEIRMKPTSNLGAHMNPVRIFLSILACCSFNNINASDWRYAGYTNTNGTDLVQFYDNGSVTIDGNLVKVWVKAIKTKDLERVGENHPEISKIAVQKMVHGYVPKFLDFPGGTSFNSKDDRTMLAIIIAYEAMANLQNTPLEMNILFEFNCKTKMYGILSFKDKDKKGIPRSVSTPNPTWDYLAPDTNMFRLSQLICGSGQE
jgi:hypothetical protein